MTLCLLALGQPRDAVAQAGKNGAVTVNTTGTILNEYTRLTANAAVGATSITVVNNSLNLNNRFGASLAAGDLLLIIQPQGATINTADANTYGTVTALNNAGRYQLVEVASGVTPGTIIPLSCRLLSTFTTAGHTQVVRVPRYSTLTIGNGTTVTAAPWDGTTGGVLAVETTGTVTLGTGATLDVSALGFRGGAVEQNSDGPVNADLGYRSTDAKYSAEKGESIVGSATEYDALGGRYGRGAPANGGGGGNSHNAAGGGGANAAATGATYTGLGNPDRGTGNAYDAAWNLEAAGFATSTSSGGGRGGYSFSTSNQNALVLAPGQAAWGGDQRQNKGGLGGHPAAVAGRVFFGGGGGAGDSNNSVGTAGGAGGGFIYVVAGGGVSGGTLLADGGSVSTPSGNDGAGGAGGGGSVVVNNATGLVSSALTARGGTGGSQVLPVPTSNEAEGAGGGGGGGYVAFTTGSPSTDVSGGANGTSSSLAVTEFTPNGATRGGVGSTNSAACTPALCPIAVADVATSVSFGNNPQTANQSATINVSFVNNGPDAAANVVRLVQLPAGLGTVTVTTSTGTGSYNNSTGQVTFTPSPLLSLANSSLVANATITFTPTTSGNVIVSSSISTTTDENCQTGNNNSGSNTLVVVYPADLQVTLSGPTSAAAGSSITYVATVQNVSPVAPNTADATSVVLTVQLPKALLTTTFPVGTTYNFNTGVATLSIGQVNRGLAAQSYNFTFKLPNNNQPVSGIASATGFEPDPVTANNDGGSATMQVNTGVVLAAGTGACSGVTFDSGPATQGLYAEYYKGYFSDVLTYFNSPKVPDLTRSEGNLNFTADNGWGDVSAAINAGTVTNPDQFSARYRGYLTIATPGSYTFTLQSDDASYLWLDNAARATTPVAAYAVVKASGQHSVPLIPIPGAAVNLTAGSHPLLAFYGENNGNNRLQILYSGPDTGGATVVIPQSALCNRQFTGPLPVELVAFTAEAAGRTARLSWRTASEKDNDHFEVERSRDGVSYVRIGNVAGAGTSTAAHDYYLVDDEAAQFGGSTVYYRLRQVDIDGTATFSPIRTVVFGAGAAGGAGFSLAPNPASQRVSLYLQTSALGQVRIFDLAGRMVLTQTLTANTNVPTLDLSSLPAGLYVVQLEQNGQRFTQRLVHEVN